LEACFGFVCIYLERDNNFIDELSGS